MFKNFLIIFLNYPEDTISSLLYTFLVIYLLLTHRKRTSKHREGTNMRYPEENLSLFGQTGAVCAQDFDEDVDDDARLPLPRCKNKHYFDFNRYYFFR